MDVKNSLPRIEICVSIDSTIANLLVCWSSLSDRVCELPSFPGSTSVQLRPLRARFQRWGIALHYYPSIIETVPFDTGLNKECFTIGRVFNLRIIPPRELQDTVNTLEVFCSLTGAVRGEVENNTASGEEFISSRLPCFHRGFEEFLH